MEMTSLGLSPEQQLAMGKAETERRESLAKSGYYGEAAKRMAEEAEASRYKRSPEGEAAALTKAGEPSRIAAAGALERDEATRQAVEDLKTKTRTELTGYQVPAGLKKFLPASIKDMGQALDIFGSSETMQKFMGDVLTYESQGRATLALEKRNQLDELARLMSSGNVSAKDWAAKTPSERTTAGLGGSKPRSAEADAMIIGLRDVLGFPELSEAVVKPTPYGDIVKDEEPETWSEANARLAREQALRQGRDPNARLNLDIGSALMQVLTR